MAINQSSFVNIADASVLAASSSYLYALVYSDYITGVPTTIFYRSANNGIDWSTDPGLTAVASQVVQTLLNGSTHIVLVGATGATCYGLDKTGTSWAALSGINDSIIYNGTYVNGVYFIFGDSHFYTSTNGTTWTERSNPNASLLTFDVTYDGSHYYFVCDTNRFYKTADFSSYTGYIMSDLYGAAKRLCYYNGVFLINTESTGSTINFATYIYTTTDFIDFTATSLSFVASNSSANFSIVDNALFITFMSAENNEATAGKVLLVTDIDTLSTTLVTQGGKKFITGAYRESGSLHQVLVSNGYVYLPCGSYLYRATYNTGWNASIGIFAALTDSVNAVFSAVFNSSTAIIEGTLRLDTSTGAFAARKVYLYNYTTGAKVAETTSNAITGQWEFTAVAPGDYFVVGVATEADYDTYNRDFDALGVITVV